MREQQQFLNHFSVKNSKGTAFIDKNNIYIYIYTPALTALTEYLNLSF